MLVRDLMQTSIFKVREDDTAGDICDLFEQAHIHAAPVVGEDDELVGMISQEDLLIGGMSRPSEGAEEGSALARTYARDIMTAPAISAGEDTHVRDVCLMMWRFRIHHLPIVRQGKLTGIISSIDICRAVGEGRLGATTD